MKHPLLKLIVPIIGVLTLMFGITQQTLADEELEKLKKEAPTSINSFKKIDPEIQKLFDSAEGYAIFPNVGKGGLVVGGAHGDGLVYQRNTLIGKARLTAVTVGAQIGGQSFEEVIFFETKEALQKFKQSEFAMSAQIGAVAAAEGASKNAKYRDGVLVFTRAKEGLMAEASVGGQKFKFEPLK
jgi:lipid-binding SYLF domain-containing protein